MGRTRWPAAAATAMVALMVAGCSTGSASYDDAVSLTAPTFAPTPPTPAASPQLEALQLRDTDGLGPPGPNADPSLVARALAALTAEFPGVDRISDLYFDESGVWLTILDPDSSSRSRSIYWRPDGLLSVGESQFVEEDTTFPLEAVDVDAITALIDGLAERYPTLTIDMPRLDVDLSYDLGLSWRMDLVDARGPLATLFTALDGTVTVVDGGSG